MDSLFIEPGLLTPRIVLDPENSKFEISEQSLPEDALAFYLPVINWIEEYGKTPNPETTVEFKMDYFNTASSRMLYKILTTLKKISSQGEINIKWFYKKPDTDMLASGKRFAKLIDIPFEFVED